MFSHISDVLPDSSIRLAYKLRIDGAPGVPAGEDFYQILPQNPKFSYGQRTRTVSLLYTNEVAVTIIIGVELNNYVIGHYQDMYYWKWHPRPDA
jgi:hypothetical protein